MDYREQGVVVGGAVVAVAQRQADRHGHRARGLRARAVCLVVGHAWRLVRRVPVEPGLIGYTCWFTTYEACVSCGAQRAMGGRMAWPDGLPDGMAATIDAALVDARTRAHTHAHTQRPD